MPHYRLQNFENETVFFEYISAEDYNTDRETDGICMGLGINVTADENTWDTKLYFTDATFLGTKLGVGVPIQDNPVWEPYISAPDMNSYERYAKNGYSYLQMLLSISVLAEKTGNQEAMIVQMF